MLIATDWAPQPRAKVGDIVRDGQGHEYFVEAVTFDPGRAGVDHPVWNLWGFRLPRRIDEVFDAATHKA